MRTGAGRKDLWAVAGLGLATLFFFRDALAGERTLIWDAADYFYPLFHDVSLHLRNFELPLWNPFLFNGFPTIANPEAQIFYPISLAFLPFTAFTPYAVHAKLILHFFLAGAFMYLLARHYLASRLSSLLSAVVYAFNGFMVGHFEHVTIIEVLVWLPLVVLLLEKAICERSPALAVFAGFFLGVSVLAGHPQTSHAIGFTLAVLALYRAATDYRRERKAVAGLTPIALVAICGAISLLIAALQLLPTTELALESSRGAPLSFARSAGSAQLSLRDLVVLLAPDYFGAVSGTYWGDIDISQGILYVGIAPLVLMGLAVLLRRKEVDVLFFAVMSLLALTVSLGANGPTYSILFSYGPGFNFFRGPANTAFLFTFFAALLAGKGLDALPARRPGSLLPLYLFGFSAVCLAVFLTGPLPLEGSPPEAMRHLRSGLAALAGLLLVSSVLVLASTSAPSSRSAWPALLLLATCGDLMANFSNAVTLGLKAPPSFHQREPDIVSSLKRHAGMAPGGVLDIALSDEESKRGLFRVYTKPEGIQGTAPFGFNRAMVFQVFLVDGFEPLARRRHRRLIDFLSARSPENLLKITNARYVTTLGPSAVTITEVGAPLQRAFLVPNARFAGDDERQLAALATSDPAREVVLAGEGTDRTGRDFGSGGWSAEVVRYQGSEVEIRTRSAVDAFLVLSDAHYPGWRAWVDGQEQPVLRANYDFRAVSLAGGDHRVVFKFRPRTLVAGAATSAAGLVLVGLAFLLRGMRST